MRDDGKPQNLAPEEAPPSPAMIVCPSCGRAVPIASSYCPYCCGEDGRRGAARRGAFLGGVFGLLAGGLATAVWSSIIGPEQAPWGPVVTITLVGGMAGIVIGAWVNREE